MQGEPAEPYGTLPQTGDVLLPDLRQGVFTPEVSQESPRQTSGQQEVSWLFIMGKYHAIR